MSSSINTPFALVIEGADILDGTGGDAFRADVGVIDDRIAAIGALSEAGARHRIGARGLTLAPGFIDCHSHDDDAVMAMPDMLPKVSQGVTTVVNGNCGLSLAPLPASLRASLRASRRDALAEPLPAPLSLFSREHAYIYPAMAGYRAAFEAAPPAVNAAQLVGHGTLRAAFVANIDRAASANEIDQMCAAIDAAMDAGCIGMSAGLAYRSSSAATTAEMIALARIVAKRGGIFTIHLRDEGAKVVESVAEAILIAREAGVPTVLSHHKCVGRNAWGLTRQTLAQISAAREADPALVLELDCYPYTASSTVLMMERAQSATRTVLTHSATFPAFAGRDLADIGREWGLTMEQTIERLSPAGAVYFNMDEDDLLRVLKFPGTMIGSDGLAGQPRPHPRLWGTFPRVLGHYVRERNVLSLADAVHRMTGVPARVFGLMDRGIIREGAFADLVLFDAATVMDCATFEAPTETAVGIKQVWVNGETVWNGCSAPGLARPGRWLTRALQEH
jgi:N-acyl-D-amino-acid deacylase